MKKLPIAALLIGLALPAAASTGPLDPGVGGGPLGFDAGGHILELATTKGSVPEHAKAAIVEYLQLSAAQIDAWDALIDETSALAEPLRDRVREINDELESFLDDDDALADVVGALVIERHDLVEELLWIHRDYVDRFEHDILTEDQHRKYHQVRAAARVQPLIPAFRLFALIPPR